LNWFSVKLRRMSDDTGNISQNQIADDEDLARLLQDEERKRGYDATAQSPPNIARQASHRGDNVAVRMNVISGVRRTQNTKLALWAAIIVDIPQIMAVAVVLAEHWEPRACDAPLHVWCLVYAINLVFTLIYASMMHIETRRRRNLVREHRQYRELAITSGMRQLREILNMFGFIWLVFGNVWFFGTNNCSQEAPEVYRLTMALLIVNYVMLCFPCIIVLLLAPFICFCLPCVIRLISYWETSHRGASPARLAALPSTVFKAGMYPPEEASCAICMSQYEDGNEIRCLPCHVKHHYHKQCVDDWLKINATCPTCRRNVFGEDAVEDENQPIQGDENV